MENWTFASIPYQRPDVEQAKRSYQAWTEQVKNAKDYAEVRGILLEIDRATMPFDEQCTVAYIRNTLNTADEFYEKELEYLNDALPELEQYSVACYEALFDSPFRKELEQEFGRQLFAQIELQKKSFCEKNIPLAQRENKLVMEYQKLMASCSIEFDGETCNLYGIQKHFEDDDRETRRRAWQAYSDFYEANEPRMEAIWDELIAVRNEMGRNLGYENFIPLAYMQQGRTDYGQEEVASFREQVRKELVPLCTKLYDYQAKRLGLEHVMVWDEERIFPDGNAHAIGGDDFLVSEAQKMYHDLSKETGAFIDFMIEHGLMDLTNRPGKASTGYMTDLKTRKAPFVFSCFNGTIGDMQVLTHELGHAFAGYRAMRCQPLSAYYGESTDIAEIHSMSMEQFCYPYAERFFGKDADKFRFAHLQDAITFVPFGVAVDEFQHICYAHPELTPKERTMQWHKLEEKYMPWRRYGENPFMERGGYWYHKLHIFHYPMYYINYTLTTMGAMEFKKKYAENREAAWADYLRLCNVGGSRSYLETLEYANVSNPFLPGSVARSTSYAKDILLAEAEKLSK